MPLPDRTYLITVTEIAADHTRTEVISERVEAPEAWAAVEVLAETYRNQREDD
jgi:hypothetical protein